MQKTLAVVAALGTFLVLTGAGSSKAPSAMGTEAAILKIEERLLKAALDGDAATMEELLADDYVVISAVSGGISNKAESIRNYKTSRLKYDSLIPSETKVHLYNPTTALVTAKVDAKGKLGDQDLAGKYRYSRLYVKRGGKWQVAALQSTSIPGGGG